MLTNVPCKHPEGTPCGGFLTGTEFEMARIRPGMSADEYHDVMYTFEVAFYNVFSAEEGRGSTQQTGTDQADS